MPIDQLSLEVIAERPVVRKDQTSDIDMAIDVVTSKTIGSQSATYAINLCIVIDRSGSMEGDKLEQAKNSCLEIYDSLNANDRFTVLAFDSDVVAVVNPQTPRNLVRDRIQALTSGGQTDLSKGWYLGLLELQTYSTDQHINRLVLLSDGQANEGEQKPSVLGAESSRARDEVGITTSTIGIGTGFQEDILAALAHESGGRFWFIGEARIEDIIKEEFSGALSVFLERPRIELHLPSSVSIIRELNDLPKTSNRYRIRPIKANDRFCFALRLRVDPSKVEGDNLSIGATIFDGAGVVKQVESVLRLGSLEEYAQSPEDSRVAMIVRKYLAAISDEKIADNMDTGNVTTMLKMLQSQSDLMKDLEAKLAGFSTISWETMADQETAEAELQRQHREHELARLRMEIQENEGLMAVGQLIDLMQGLGRAELVLELMTRARKMHKHREIRNRDWGDRGGMDDWAAERLLAEASQIAANLISDYPSLKEELTTIRERIDERLAHFS
jgi:Ca-activated chloride channel family protein